MKKFLGVFKDFWSGAVLLALCAGTLSAVSVPMGTSLASDAEYVMQITGKAHFERKQTLVPLALCEPARICPRSEPYWVLVVQEENGYRYQLAQTFALGSKIAPEAVEVAGIVVRPGSRLTLDARVRPIAENYAMISEVQDLTVVMDLSEDDCPMAAEVCMISP